LFFASVIFRYPNLLLGAPFCAALLLGGRFVPRHGLIVLAVGLPFAAVILLFNQLVYGAPLTTGFHLGAALLHETANYSSESFFKRRPDVLLQYIRLYSALPLVSVPVALGFGAAVMAVVSRSRKHALLAWLTLGVFAILLVYYGQQDAWGFKSPHLAASFLRYLLPAFALMFPFAAWAVAAGAARWGSMVYAAPVVFVIASAWFAYNGNGGVADMYAAIDASRVAKEQILQATDPDDIIATRISDKVLFPERQTLTLTYGIQNETPVSKGELETWDYVPPPDRLAEIAEITYAAGISLYLMPDGRMQPFAPYQAAAKQRGYYFRRIVTVEATPFYKVSRMPAEPQ
jgi:hypothetical protein